MLEQNLNAGHDQLGDVGARIDVFFG